MIARYRLPEMTRVWDDRRRYQLWLEVELAVCEELARLGKIPKSDWAELRKKAGELLEAGGVDPEAVERHEKVTRHDVIAFTTAVAERIGPVSRYIHYGLTSSDVVDTALSMQIHEAGKRILSGIEALLTTLEKLARAHQKLATIGRSHGIFAEPTSFGLKFLGWHAEWTRNRERVSDAIERARFGKLSGAVGVNAHWSPAFEASVLERLDLKREPVSTQVLPRDRHAEVLWAIAICGSSMERAAIELRHLQRSEVSEVREGFSKGQKGSSAMPHKRNPISSENLTGCARMLRAYAGVGLENVALWHERDISHSSVERIAFPDAFCLLDYALNRFRGVLEALEILEERVRGNLEAAGKTVYSGHFLLALVEAGETREDAYRWVQECALAALDGKGEFVALLAKHERVSKVLGAQRIRELGSLEHQLRHVPEIYAGALGGPKKKRAGK